MKQYFFQGPLWFLLFFLVACGEQSGRKAGKESKDLLPSSSGSQGEILVMIDSTNWKGPLGESVRSVLMDTFPGLARPEPWFDVRPVAPENMNNFFKRHRNLVFISTINNSGNLPNTGNYFNKKSLQRIRSNPRFFMYEQENKFAHPQHLLHLFGPDKDRLIKNLRQYGKQVREKFTTWERSHIRRNINRHPKANKAIKALQNQASVSLTLPEGFKVAEATRHFIWLRCQKVYADLNIMLSKRPYYSQKQFSKKYLVNWRDSLGKQHIFGSGQKDTTTYLTTQDYIPVQADTVNFQGKYARQLRGLWKLRDNTMGGSFISYAFTTDQNQSLCYLEAFVYAHGNNPDMRNKIRRMDVILNTFNE